MLGCKGPTAQHWFSVVTLKKTHANVKWSVLQIKNNIIKQLKLHYASTMFYCVKYRVGNWWTEPHLCRWCKSNNSGNQDVECATSLTSIYVMFDGAIAWYNYKLEVLSNWVLIVFPEQPCRNVGRSYKFDTRQLRPLTGPHVTNHPLTLCTD